VVSPAAVGFALCIGCVPLGKKSEPIEGYVQTIQEVVIVAAGLKGKVADLRMTPNDHPLGYGKWQGALADAARDVPPVGVFTVPARADQLTDIVVAAIRNLTSDVTVGSL
jgi:hypothetical protein